MNAVSDIPNVIIAAPALEELMPQLLQLSADARLEVITRLSQSLKSTTSPPSSTEQQRAILPAFVGAWTDDPEAEKMAQAILSIRHSISESESK